MKTFTQDEMKLCWKAVKAGMYKRQIAEMLNLTEDEVVELYGQAHKEFGRKPKAAKVYDDSGAKEKHHTPPKPLQRPPAVYDNPSHDDVLNKYLNS